MDERFLLTEIPPEVREIAERLLKAGHEAWYVGGAIRDALLSRRTDAPADGRTTTRDFDIATSARPEEIVALFRRTVPIGIEHGTVAVLDRDNRAHEVTTFRRDIRTDGRHAEVEFGVSLDDDLARRDFTINAIAVHPDSGEVRDPFGGRADLAAGIVRAVGDPATRFREDRLRVLRGLRFAAALGFTLHDETWRALLASSGELDQLSRERVRDEWMKSLASAAPSAAVSLWRRAGVLTAVWPELATLPDAALPALDAAAADPVLATAAVLAHAGASPRAAADAGRRLRFSHRDADRVEAVVAAMTSAWPEPGDAAAVRRWVAKHRAVASDALLASTAPGQRELRATVRRVIESGAPLSLGELAVTGDDLKAAGIPPGPAMGETLRRLLEAVLDDPSLNTREALLARAQPARPAG